MNGIPNSITEDLQQKSHIISQIAQILYFGIPEEFGDGPEHFMKHLENYSLEELLEILDAFQKKSQNKEIGNIKDTVRDKVESLVQSYELIVSQLIANKGLIEKVLRKKNAIQTSK